jgi:hypothetical protein
LLFIASIKGAADAKRVAAIPKAGMRRQPRPLFALKNNCCRSLGGFCAGNPDLKPGDGWCADRIVELVLKNGFSATSAPRD